MGSISEEFELSLDEIETLIELPNTIQEAAVESLKNLLKKNDYLKPATIPEIGKIIEFLKNISKQSLSKKYNIIFNQLCTLAVSSLSAALEKSFINAVNRNRDDIDLKELDEVKVSLAEILTDYESDPANYFGEILISHKDSGVKFQDLQSIKRSFEKYAGIRIKLDVTTESQIIFYQQVRHLIVHKSSHVDKAFLKSVGKIGDINGYKVGDKIQLSNDDWLKIRSSFTQLVVQTELI